MDLNYDQDAVNHVADSVMVFNLRVLNVSRIPQLANTSCN